MVDEYTRECLALVVARRIRAEDVLDVLAELVVHVIAGLGRRAVRKQVQAAPGEQQRLELSGTAEAFQAQGAILGGTKLVQLFGLDEQVLAGTILVAADDLGHVDGSMHGAVLGVADALAAGGVELVAGGQVAAADGRVGLERDADQAELKQAGPTRLAAGSGVVGEQGFRGWGLVSSCRVHGISSGNGMPVPPTGRDLSEDSVSRGWPETSRQFRLLWVVFDRGRGGPVGQV